MKNKITIAIVALMVAALVAPGVMADVTYTATVVTSSVTIAQTGTAFGDLLAGGTKEISPSLTLTNSGGAAADVDAKFTSNDGTTYGLTSASNVIGGSNFQIGTDENEVTLSNEDSNTALGSSNQVPAIGYVDYDAILTVPGDQVAGSYTGIVQLTFTAV